MKLIDLNTSLGQLLLNCPECRWFAEELGIAVDDHRGKSLADVCRIHDLEPRTTARMLTAFCAGIHHSPAVSVELMTLTELCNHLERGNHVRLRADLRLLDQLTRIAAEQYASDDPGLLTIREHFVAFRKKFAAHLCEEAELIFPVLRQLDAAKAGKHPRRSSLKSPLARMEQEHRETDEWLADLRELVRTRASRSSRPGIRRTISDAFARMERKVHEQIYMEAHVLYPRSLAIRETV
jgi:iron-sulfur cluster repair protein YtfE (RIC family)